MSDAIRLTIPRTRPFYGVARLVVGGLAARLDLSFDYLEDLQVALDSVIANDAYAVGPDVTVELRIGDAAMELDVGPLDGARLGADLEGDDAPRGGGLPLKRLLTTVVEEAALEQRDGAAWLRLRKVLPAGATG